MRADESSLANIASVAVKLLRVKFVMSHTRFRVSELDITLAHKAIHLSFVSETRISIPKKQTTIFAVC
jgi:hypothetical protein